MKKIILVLSIFLLAASCNPFKKTAVVGVVKTINGGVDWQFANVIKDEKTASLADQSISVMRFDPQNREIVFAGSFSGGLFKSEDSAGSWQRLLTKIFVYDFAIHPQDSKIIYASGFYAGHGRVLKSTDAGASWQEIYLEESLENAVRAITLNPAVPNEIFIGTTVGGLLKSVDAGQNWKPIYSFGDRVQRIFVQNNEIYVLGKTKGMFKSTDNGQSFTNITLELTKKKDTYGYVLSDEAVSNFNQAFVDSITTNLILLTTEKGVYKTSDGGISWQLLKLPINQEKQAARAVAVSRTTSNLIYASVGLTIYKSTDGGQSWQTRNIPSVGFINSLLIDPELPQIVYAGIYGAE